MWRFYKDVTSYALLILVITLFFGNGIIAIVFFGILGTPIGFLAYNYFQKDELYGYYNLGYTKAKLLAKCWLINFILSPLLILIVLLISKFLSIGAPTSY
uniref:Uncharacterized protein n=1 Tax=uncultured Leeuwenhoekiella sp. TaxID=487010 RepID=F4MLN2_9FLAO|nr:hypothetical protein [uncultured bacterium]AOE08652.1 hypothetical protein [uncultured bacterium]CBL80593.1 conserved hypothetical protein, membrane [uncultured Leeuwenhoekiella sp.]